MDKTSQGIKKALITSGEGSPIIVTSLGLPPETRHGVRLSLKGLSLQILRIDGPKFICLKTFPLSKDDQKHFKFGKTVLLVCREPDSKDCWTCKLRIEGVFPSSRPRIMKEKDFDISWMCEDSSMDEDIIDEVINPRISARSRASVSPRMSQEKIDRIKLEQSTISHARLMKALSEIDFDNPRFDVSNQLNPFSDKPAVPTPSQVDAQSADASVRVLDSIGKAGGPDLDRQYGVLVKGIAVVRGQHGDETWDRMTEVFPWTASANAALARSAEIMGRGRGGGIRPLLLVGPPGIGKTRWAREAAAALGLPFKSFSFAGVSTSMLVSGSERGWRDAHPGLAARAMASLSCANPLVLLDEVDKAGEGRNNGSALDALLPLLERESAARIEDVCLLGTVDASRISWVLTANSSEHLPQPLLSRVTLIRIESPHPSLLPGLLPHMVEDIRLEWGLDEEAMPTLSDPEIDALIDSYTNGRHDLRPIGGKMRSVLGSKLWEPPKRNLH